MPCSVFDAAQLEPSSQPDLWSLIPQICLSSTLTRFPLKLWRTVSDELKLSTNNDRRMQHHPCNKKKQVLQIDELLCKLAIERVGPKGNGKGDATYTIVLL